MQPLLLSLPDDLADWRGTAAGLADKLNVLLASVPSLRAEAGAANERLLRHYVQVGVLTAPEREGREAWFGLRQVVEFMAARRLLKDGWPLAKVAELVRSTDVAGLAELVPTERPRTPRLPSMPTYTVPPELPPGVARAADLSRRRASLEEDLKALGNPAGRPGRKRIVRLELTPWCHVDVDLAQFGAMDDDTPATLGAALTQSLQEERVRQGR